MAIPHPWPLVGNYDTRQGGTSSTPKELPQQSFRAQQRKSGVSHRFKNKSVNRKTIHSTADEFIIDNSPWEPHSSKAFHRDQMRWSRTLLVREWQLRFPVSPYEVSPVHLGDVQAQGLPNKASSHLSHGLLEGSSWRSNTDDQFKLKSNRLFSKPKRNPVIWRH